MDFETPDADAVEQAQQPEDTTEEDPSFEEVEPGGHTEADPADLAEQRSVVPDDDGGEWDRR